ncbi:hypothetical protein HYH02_007209 [Chlamydomonas schloesseri]|uniref:Uncharacterized protein n=1 Tax=Chlamydomonas schloesseri TaxID=2026947 RepID=A0A835WIH1_9CHLO|nr:hypothetical protein HYH02_007209 [Chlamydomonas schloesseri]|eukprot:KAG2447751.1 hypothetical protein HYH02_007209 [Chlamydomonas schloesseri]
MLLQQKLAGRELGRVGCSMPNAARPARSSTCAYARKSDFSVSQVQATVNRILEWGPKSLNGYLFEVHVWATFNFDAKAKGLPYRAQMWDNGGGGAVDVHVYDLSDPGTTLLEAQLKVRAGDDYDNGLLNPNRYCGMTRITTTDYVMCKNGVCATDTLSYGGARSLPLSSAELEELCRRPDDHFRRVKLEIDTLSSQAP